MVACTRSLRKADKLEPEKAAKYIEKVIFRAGIQSNGFLTVSKIAKSLISY